MDTQSRLLTHLTLVPMKSILLQSHFLKPLTNTFMRDKENMIYQPQVKF